MAAEIFNPGRMRYSITLQAPQSSRGADGSEVRTWPDTATVRAAIDFGEGREFFAAKSVNADMTHLVTVYTVAGLDSTWRGKFVDGAATRYFDIKAVVPKGTMRRYQVIHCRELVGREATS